MLSKNKLKEGYRMSGYYLWIPTRDVKTYHPLDSERVVKLAGEKIYVFGSNRSWAISEAQTLYGLLGAKLHNIVLGEA